MYRGLLHFFNGKRNLQVSRSPMCIFPFNKTDMKQYLTHTLKRVTSSADTNEKVDHWLDYFEKFYKKNIIMPSQSLDSSFLEESLFITVRSPPGFINQENETRCYLNAKL